MQLQFTLVPVFRIHHVLILNRIGSKFSLPLSLQFPSFQECETTFFCGIHGGFVDIVQLKLKEAKSVCFFHFTIDHKNTLERECLDFAVVNQHGRGFERHHSVSGIY